MIEKNQKLSKTALGYVHVAGNRVKVTLFSVFIDIAPCVVKLREKLSGDNGCPIIIRFAFVENLIRIETFDPEHRSVNDKLQE
jgi:hypothetical protein